MRSALPRRRYSPETSIFACSLFVAVLVASCAPDWAVPGGSPIPTTASPLSRTCSSRCAFVDDAQLLGFATADPDSADVLMLVAEFAVTGTIGNRLSLLTRSDEALKRIAGTAALVVQVGGGTSEFQLRALRDSSDVYVFTRDESISIRYFLRRGAVRGGVEELQLTQVATGATVIGAFTPWHRPSPRPRLCSGGSCPDSSDCEMLTAIGTCGTVGWVISPFSTPSHWHANEFQSGTGTGQSSTITITFSQPIMTANVLIEDPTYAGNTAVARDSSLATVASASFAYSGISGVNHPDSAVLSGSIKSIVLTPASGDYVAYHLVVLLKPHIVITFDTASTPTNGGIPLLLPKEFARADIKPIYSGGAWPDSMRFKIKIDSAGHPLANRTIALLVIPVDSGGSGSDGPYGHHHFGVSGGPAKPRGTVPSTVSTGDSIGTFTYRSSQYSGPETIRATNSSADTAQVKLAVGVKNLVRIDSSSTVLWIGPTGPHPTADSHYATDSMKTMLSALASAFATAHHGKPIPLNDMSLGWGGRFDFDTTKLWSAGHVEHRAGRSADLRTVPGTPGALTDLEKHWVYDFWNDSLNACVHPEINPVHWHLQQTKEPGLKCI